MLFVNEEIEENQPIFSEPKKVHPATEDEMARRIKNMLGDYVPEEDGDIYDFEDVFKNSQSVPSTFYTDSKSLKSKTSEESMLSTDVNSERNDKTESYLEESTNSVNISSVEVHDKNTEVEACGISSRRSSLKRQCKEKISLLDYNPMFTIRNKRTKTNSSSHKPKSIKYSEDSSCFNGDSAALSSTCNNLPSNLIRNTQRLLNDISVDEKCSEFPKFDSFTNDDLDEPPLLDPVSISSDKTSCENSEMLEILDDSFKDQPFTGNTKDRTCASSLKDYNCDDSVSKENTSQPPLNTQMKIKSKKQSKKKKKKLLYESSTVPKDGGDSTYKNGDNMTQTSEPTVGSCQIKNGIIKIRLSKLIDNKKDIGDNDYEVTLCESDALIGCKTLSVPLSPLAPAVYSAYCENLKIKKKSHSKKSKKKGKKNGTFKPVEKKIEKENEVDTCTEQNCLENCELENSNKSQSELSTFDTDMTERSCENENVKGSVPEGVEAETNLCTSIDLACVDNSSGSLCDNTNSENPSSNVNTQNSIENEPSDSCNSFTVNAPLCLSSKHEVLPKLMGSEILCSINLALLDRIPERSYLSAKYHNDTSHANLRNDKEVKDENAFNSVHSNLRNDISNFNLGNDSDVIKKERYTPPACELSRIPIDSSENANSPVNNLLEISEDETCPNLIPAYSIDSPRDVPEKISNFVENEKHDLHGSKLVVLPNDSIPVLQRDACDRLDQTVFNHNSHYN